MKTQTFDKKRETFQWKKIFGHFFSYYRVWQISGNNLWGSIRYSGNYCGSIKINILGPKMLLKTQIFQKKCRLSKEGKILAHFSRNIEHDKYRETFYKSSEGNLTYNMQMIRSFLWDIRGRKEQTSEKKAFFKMAKHFGPFFLVLSKVTNLNKHLTRVHRLFWPLL